MATPLYLQKNLVIVFGVTLMVVMSVSSTMPVLPDIAANMGIARAHVGWVITMFTLPGVILAPVAGILADRKGRKAVLVPSLLIFGLAGPLCAFAPDWNTLLLFRFLQGIGGASLGVVNSALIGDLFQGEELTAAMGYNASVLSIGTAGFPAIGGLMSLAGWRVPFLLPLVAIPLAFIVWFKLDNPEPDSSGNIREYFRESAGIFKTRRAIMLFTLTFLTFTILYGCLITFFPLLLRTDFHAPAHVIGGIMSGASAISAIAAGQLGWLSKRFRPRNLLLAACVLYAVSMAMIPGVESLWFFLVPVTIYGLAQGLNIPLVMSLLVKLAPAKQRAVVMAANGMILRLSQTVAPLMMGQVFAFMGMDYVFYAGAATGLVMFIMFATVKKRSTQEG